MWKYFGMKLRKEAKIISIWEFKANLIKNQFMSNFDHSWKNGTSTHKNCSDWSTTIGQDSSLLNNSKAGSGKMHPMPANILQISSANTTKDSKNLSITTILSPESTNSTIKCRLQGRKLKELLLELLWSINFWKPIALRWRKLPLKNILMEKIYFKSCNKYKPINQVTSASKNCNSILINMAFKHR